MRFLSIVAIAVGLLVASFVAHPAPTTGLRVAPARATVELVADVRSASRPLARPPAASRSATRPALHAGCDCGVWRALAACEASGRWHLDTGNGYYGGLQITWDNARHYGFSRPDLLTVGEQVRLARLVLRDQGVMAWPVCGPRVGLQSRS